MSLASLTSGVGTLDALVRDSILIPDTVGGPFDGGRESGDAVVDNDTPTLPEGPVVSLRHSELGSASAIGPTPPPEGHDASSPLAAQSDSRDSLSDSLLQIPGILRAGVPMLKVSSKKVQQRMVRIAPEEGRILWESRKGGVSAFLEIISPIFKLFKRLDCMLIRICDGFPVNFENILDLRFGSSARHYRELFKISAASESRWITIVFTTQSKYKLLHLVALSDPDFRLWRDTLVSLFHLRRQLMEGLDHMRKRQSVWLRQHWKIADESGNERLAFEDVESLCRKLGIVASRQGLRKNFDEADVQQKGYLDFTDFQIFVKLLKRRPEVERLMLDVAEGADVINLTQFSEFMRFTQEVSKMRFCLNLPGLPL
jgi:phosphatidylinositol phospholipase C, delta